MASAGDAARVTSSGGFHAGAGKRQRPAGCTCRSAAPERAVARQEREVGQMSRGEVSSARVREPTGNAKAALQPRRRGRDCEDFRMTATTRGGGRRGSVHVRP
jgi:hypothetical protein